MKMVVSIYLLALLLILKLRRSLIYIDIYISDIHLLSLNWLISIENLPEVISNLYRTYKFKLGAQILKQPYSVSTYISE